MIALLQWPAMVVTVLATWFVASQNTKRRKTGFWIFMVSNLLWVIWAINDAAYGLIALQAALTAMNIRGAFKNAQRESP